MVSDAGKFSLFRFTPGILTLFFLFFFTYLTAFFEILPLNSPAYADTICTTWQNGIDMQQTRTSFAGGVINGKIYVFGGSDPDDANPVRKTLEVFDPATGKWTFLAENGQDVNEGGQWFYDQGVEEISAAVLNDKLYVFGADILHAPTDDFNYEYDPATDTWKELAGRNTVTGGKPTKSPMVTTYNGKIYLFGGQYLADDNLEGEHSRDVLEYDPAGNSWSKVTEAPADLSATVVATVGNRAYLMGGAIDSPGYVPTESGPHDFLPQVLAYDFQEDEWITSGLGSLDKPMVWPGATSQTTVVNGQIFLTGGITTIDPDKFNLIYDYDLIPTNRVLVYDTGTHRFSEAEPLPYYLYAHLTVRVGEDVYVLGGETLWVDAIDKVFKLGCSSCSQSMPEIVFPDENRKVTSNTVTFSWNSSGSSFPIEIQENDGTPVFTGTITDKQKTIPGLPDGAYRWRVAATSDTCTSNWSGWTSFYVEFTPPGNLVAYYPLDVNAEDYSGNELHGTGHGGVEPTAGISGGARIFDGIDGNISLLSGQYTGDNYSYSMWVRPNNLSDTIRTIFSVQGTFAINYQNGDIQLHSDTIQKNVPDILEENVWTHLVFVYRSSANNGSIAVYKNGSFVTELTDIALGTGPQTANIGTDGSNYMRGSIDDFRVYYTNLNVNEIQALYAEKTNNTPEFEFTDKSKAIILAGGGDVPGNWLWEDTKRVTDFAYNALLWQGYAKDNIQYLRDNQNGIVDDEDNDGFDDDDVDTNGLEDDVDDTANLANLEDAITTWAEDADNLVLYLADHGDIQNFIVRFGDQNEILSAATLDSWLDDLQETMSGRIIIIYEACYSGSFIDSGSFADTLQGDNRIIITSSGSKEKSKFQEYGRLSFSYQFWAGVYEGAKLAESFNHGNSMMTAQTAWYDTDGLAPPNSPSDIFPDIVIGPGFLSVREQPIITDRSPLQVLKQGDAAPLWAKVNSSANTAFVWAMVVPPAYDPSAPDTPANELPIVQLTYSAANDRYQGTYTGFTSPGVYQVSFYALDDKGGISSPRTSTVEKRAKQPFPWILFCPILGAAAQ